MAGRLCGWLWHNRRVRDRKWLLARIIHSKGQRPLGRPLTKTEDRLWTRVMGWASTTMQCQPNNWEPHLEPHPPTRHRWHRVARRRHHLDATPPGHAWHAHLQRTRRCGGDISV